MTEDNTNINTSNEEIIDINGDGKLKKIILREGTGAKPFKGQKVSVHYVGTLESDGSKFDSSRDRDSPFEFTIGQGVIEGWSIGVATMKVGELSKFIIHSDLAYKSSGSPPKIPGGATLIFEIELLDIIKNKTKDEAIGEANSLAEKAAIKFRSGEYQNARDLYEQAMKCLKNQYGKDIDDLKKKFNGNLALVHSKLGEWGPTFTCAEEVLKKEAKNIRALLRKCEAEIHLGRIEDAKKTLKDGQEASNNDPAFNQMISMINDAEKSKKRTQDELFAKMVGKH